MKNPSSSRAISKKKRRVLLIINWWEDRVFSGVANRIFKGIMQYALEHGWTLNFEMRLKEAFVPSQWHGDGIVVWMDSLGELSDYLQSTKIPAVDICFQAPRGIPQVFESVPAIGICAAQHLLELGFRDLAFVSKYGEHHPREKTILQGFRETAEQAGARFCEIPIGKLKKMIPRLPKPLGVMAVNDEVAFEVMRIIRAANGQIPEEFAVVGSDNSEYLCDLATIPLSSVDWNFEKKGYTAAATLDRLMDGKPASEKPVLIQPKGVVQRKSTDILALPDRDTTRLWMQMRDHYHEPVTIGKFARQSGVSLRKAQSIFLQATGRSLGEELARLRIEHARKLLATTTMKIEAIALESGFSNRIHFHRIFLKVAGQGPQQFRKNAKMSKNR